MRIASLVVVALACLALAPGCGPPATELCRLDADCDDRDPCTIDACQVEAGACEHTTSTAPACRCTTAADCSPAGACQMVSCAAGTCRTEPLEGCCAARTDCPASAEECERATCVEGACGFERDPACDACASDGDCDDGDACTTDGCLDGVCVHDVVASCGACSAAIECDDGDDCTEDACDAGTCSNTPITSCGTPTDLTFAVTTGPEGMAVVQGGFLDLAAGARHVLVIGSGAGVSDVNLSTGAITELFSPFGGYSLDCYQASSGDYCAAPGPLGSYLLSTGATVTDSSGNTTDAVASPPDATGLSPEVLYLQANRVRAVSTSFAAPREVPATAFPGGAFPGQPTSGAWIDADTVLLLFQNGEVWTAPLSPIGSSADATRVGDLGGDGASMRYLNCTPFDAERICVATNFGEDTAHIIHIDPGSIHFGPVITTASRPVESDVRLTITGALFASAGFDDDEVRVHAYDGTDVTLVASRVLSDCDGPGHCAWVDDDTLAVTCNLSDTLRVVPRDLGE